MGKRFEIPQEKYVWNSNSKTCNYHDSPFFHRKYLKHYCQNQYYQNSSKQSKVYSSQVNAETREKNNFNILRKLCSIFTCPYYPFLSNSVVILKITVKSPSLRSCSLVIWGAGKKLFLKNCVCLHWPAWKPDMKHLFYLTRNILMTCSPVIPLKPYSANEQLASTWDKRLQLR